MSVESAGTSRRRSKSRRLLLCQHWPVSSFLSLIALKLVGRVTTSVSRPDTKDIEGVMSQVSPNLYNDNNTRLFTYCTASQAIRSTFDCYRLFSLSTYHNHMHIKLHDIAASSAWDLFKSTAISLWERASLGLGLPKFTIRYFYNKGEQEKRVEWRSSNTHTQNKEQIQLRIIMDLTRFCLLLFLISTYAADFFTPCDGRNVQSRRTTKKLQLAKYWDVIGQKASHVDGPTNSQPYISSPFTLPPLPNNAPPYCSYPQTTPTPPPPPSLFEPPVIYPPPSAPPPPQWCVAKASVPDPIIREAMNYACGTAADCDSILPNGPCFLPNTLLAHASYAFNSYWQKTKMGGGAATCQFAGTAMLVTVDPSYDGCHFVYT